MAVSPARRSSSACSARNRFSCTLARAAHIAEGDTGEGCGSATPWRRHWSHSSARVAPYPCRFFANTRRNTNSTTSSVFSERRRRCQRRSKSRATATTASISGPHRSAKASAEPPGGAGRGARPGGGYQRCVSLVSGRRFRTGRLRGARARSPGPSPRPAPDLVHVPCRPSVLDLRAVTPSRDTPNVECVL